MVYSDEHLRLLEGRSALGDRMVRFRESEYDFLNEHVLKELEEEVYVKFVKIDPSDAAQVTELQKILFAIEKIRRKIDEIISTGIVAREELKAMSLDK